MSAATVAETVTSELNSVCQPEITMTTLRLNPQSASYCSVSCDIIKVLNRNDDE